MLVTLGLDERISSKLFYNNMRRYPFFYNSIYKSIIILKKQEKESKIIKNYKGLYRKIGFL